MYHNLYEYLVRNNELPLPGIGTFLLNREPAIIDFPNKKIYPPSYSITLNHDSYVPGQAFFNWLAAGLDTTPREAIFRFNDFAFELKKSISNGNQVNWKGVGILQKGESGEIVFEGSGHFTPEVSVPAERIIREKSEHNVRVGEDERTSTEMTALLKREEESSIGWWVYALAIGVIALMFTGWYLSEHGTTVFSIANNMKLEPDDSPLINYTLLK
jgi:hypothetical protein